VLEYFDEPQQRQNVPYALPLLGMGAASLLWLIMVHAWWGVTFVLTCKYSNTSASFSVSVMTSRSLLQ
jgi:hypothetical protein